MKRILLTLAALGGLIAGSMAISAPADGYLSYTQNGGSLYDYHKTCNDTLSACFIAKTDAFIEVTEPASGTRSEPIKLHFWGTDLTGNLGYWLVGANATCYGFNGSSDTPKWTFVHIDMSGPHIDGGDMGEYVGVYFLNGTGPTYAGTNLRYTCTWSVNWNGHSDTDHFTTVGYQ